MSLHGCRCFDGFTRQQGVTYVILLFMVALTGMVLVGVAQVWHTLSQRDKEAELLFVGKQFRTAIESYYRASPGLRKFPQSLDDLLRDQRFPNMRRHLRKIFIDPMTGKAEWGIERQEGIGILGVYSLAEGVPLKQSGFAATDPHFADAVSYRNWVFAFRPSAPDAVAGAGLTQAAAVGSAEMQSTGPAQDTPPPSAADREKLRQTRSRTCGIQRRSDNEACRLAEQQHGSQLAGRCAASAQQRYAGCLDGSSDATQPLDDAAF